MFAILREFATAWLLVLYCLTINSAALACASEQDMLNRAAVEYSQRHSLPRAESAADHYRQVITHDPFCPLAAEGLAKTMVWIGVMTSGKKELQAYIDAGEAAQKLVGMRPEMVHGHYWLGVARALQAKICGSLEGWQLALMARDSLQKALKLDPSYESGGPHRVLGRLYGKMPTLLGGDKTLAEWHLRQALAVGPNYWINHLYLADLLVENSGEEEARRLLRQVISGRAPKDMQVEHDLWRQKAQTMLSKMEGE